MNYLFRRLTGMFWFLFLGVICAFGINFYSRYEENYKQKLVDFELAVTQARDNINHHITFYEKIIDESISMFNMFYQDSYTYYDTLPQNQLNFYSKYEKLDQFEFNDQDQLVDTLALKKTSEQLNQFLNLMYKYNNEEYPIVGIRFLPDLSTTIPTQLFISEDQQQYYHYLLDGQNKFELRDRYIWKYPEQVTNSESGESQYKYTTLFKAVQTGDEILGYITV
ncbi:MAG TPA: hypothetical protein DCY20_04630, partial [Firmicutes bacterium]|nr:hypothetical protein [Bacillota bacterium]